MQHWEYKTIKFKTKGFISGGNLDEEDLENQLNELGFQGWELVSAFDTNKIHGTSNYIVAIFKRPR